MNRNWLMLFSLLFVVITLTGPVMGANTVKTGNTPVAPVIETNTDDVLYLQGQVIVKFKDNISSREVYRQAQANQTGIKSIDNKIQQWQVTRVSPVFPKHIDRVNPGSANLARIFKLQFSTAEDVMAVVNAFGADPAVEYAEPVYISKINATPNDPSLNKQTHWNIMKTAEAWDISKGSANVIISIIDTGVDWDHDDLAAHIKENLGEDTNHDGKFTTADVNNIDDDGNGYIDDFRGWDFVDSYEYSSDDTRPAPGEDGANPDNDPNDFNGHGTHCAGLASAVTDNATGVAGMGWSCSILPVRCGYQGRDGNGYVIDGYNGVVYATDNGANIISMSWGGSRYSSYAQDIINYAWENGVVLVSGSGNSDPGAYGPHYPGSYENVLCVAATIHDVDKKASFSNYHTSVDVCAPGTQIYSTLPNSAYGYMSGTSMSTPIVAGLAGLVKALHPGWSNERIVTQIVETTDNIDEKNPTYAGWLGSGRVNAYRALTENPVQFVDYEINDAVTGNGNGVVDNGETVQLIITLNSIAEDMDNVTVTASSSDPKITFTSNAAVFPALLQGQAVDNSASPIVLTVDASTPIGYEALIKLVIADNNGYASTRFFKMLIQPLYMNHDINNVDFTITSFGAYGYNDYAESDGSIGTGFRYPKENYSALFLGSLWVASGPNQVSDCSYGNAAYDNYDWVTSEGGNINIGGKIISDQDGKAIFNDSRAQNPLGVEVTQNSYAWSGSPDDDYVILEFQVKNTTGQMLNNIYVGLYMDWDVSNGDDNVDFAGWDTGKKLGYMSSSGAAYYGISMLYPQPVSYRAIDHNLYVYNNALTDDLKYDFMSEGFVATASTQNDDWSHVLSAGPFSIAPGGNETVTFAVLGGDNLNDLRNNVQAAGNKYFAMAPAGIRILHTPLRDTENTATPYQVVAEVIAESAPVNPDSVMLYWQIGNEERLYSSEMTPLVGDMFQAEIPAQSETAIHYYFMAYDQNNRLAKLPYEAPFAAYTFYAGVDVVKPEISNVTQLPNTFNMTGPFVVTAKVTDNIVINDDKVTLDYSINNGETVSVDMSRDIGTDIFRGTISLDAPLHSGDRVKYTVRAFDYASNPNSLASDNYEFKIVTSLLVDDFEGANSKWDLDAGWGPNFYAYSGNNSMTDSPDGYYSPDSVSSLTLLDSYDLSGKNNAAVSFYYIHSLSSGDSVFFEVTGDGATWKKMLTFSGESGYDWSRQIISLDDYTGAIGEQVRFRFRLASNEDSNVADGIYIDDVYIFADTVLTGVENETGSALPKEYSLAQNYPNPFNPVTTIHYELPEDGKVSLEIYSILGERIATLVNREHRAGRYEVLWNGRNDSGAQVSSGVYFYKLKTRSFTDVKKMILIK
ncbi:MAG TPA: S8 family serine peptidase [bacterium]|nr:S8 family serine peptidase [bacterium]HPN45171.1 S8 family serine peptidase [bacterium]